MMMVIYGNRTKRQTKKLIVSRARNSVSLSLSSYTLKRQVHMGQKRQNKSAAHFKGLFGYRHFQVRNTKLFPRSGMCFNRFIVSTCIQIFVGLMEPLEMKQQPSWYKNNPRQQNLNFEINGGIMGTIGVSKFDTLREFLALLIPSI